MSAEAPEMKKLSNFGLWIYLMFLLVIAGCMAAPSLITVESSTPEMVIVNNAMGYNFLQGRHLAETECAKYGKRVVSQTPCSKFFCYKSRVTYECGD